MKHLSQWLTVLLLGALPLAAAALDYGPDRPLLAANTGASRAAGLQLPASAPNASPERGAGDRVDEDTTAERDLARRPLAAPPAPATAAHSRKASADKSPRATTPPKPPAEADPPSWRSLLPGSIQ